MIKKILKIKKREGFVILFAVTLAAILLSIALGVSNIALKEVQFGTSAKDADDAFFAADSGIEQALYNDKNPNSYIAPGIWNFVVSGLGSSGQSCANVTVDKTASPTVTITANGYNIGNGSCNSTNPNRVERELVTTYGNVSSSPSDTVWVEDALPAGAVSQQDPFNWLASNPTPFSGSFADQSLNTSGNHQQFFINATNTLTVNVGDAMVAYVYLNSINPPTEIMLQWNVGGSWEHRAYWGANNIGWGIDGTISRSYQGILPTAGQWVRLVVPASLVGLEGTTINGMAFTLYDGQATWDHAGKNP